jgi:proteasome assembly chaperone (PAC2) family protein
MNANPEVKLYATPHLVRPHMVAAWSGMGGVALLTANVLRQELDAQLLGEIDPYHFFSPSQVLIRDGLIREPELPEQKFYYWQGSDEHDLILMIGTEQPDDTRGVARLVIDVARRFGVERIYTGAAMATFIHHSQEPRVWGTSTHPELLPELRALGVQIMEEGTISGLNGVLLAEAREAEIEGICLLGELPVYATQLVNPKAAQAVLSVLAPMLGVEITLNRLAAWGATVEPQLDQLYQLLPEQAREAIESAEQPSPSTMAEATSADQPLVADDRFFDEIERFLKDSGEDQESDSEDESDA